MKIQISEQQKVQELIYNFFIKSSDFNGIPLRDISKKFAIKYEHSIEVVKSLVLNDLVSIQSSTNPHIIGASHHNKNNQLKVLEGAKDLTGDQTNIGNFVIEVENTEYPICVYPSKEYLHVHRDLSSFGFAEYSKELALGHPQLGFRFFELDVLERYSTDPRFNFEFQDFSGSISCKCDENGNPIQRSEDQIFLKSFGLGFDDKSNRLIAVLLTYLGKLTPEHQIYWKSKEVPGVQCKVLEDYYDNIIKGNWIKSHSVFSAFIGEINAIYTLTNEIFGIPLFRKDFSGDRWPKNFTFFFNPTLKNYYDFVNLLDKYIAENLNHEFFKSEIELEELKQIGDGTFERIRKGTIRLLGEWLAKKIRFHKEEAVKEIIKPFKKVRNERQKPAHKIIDDEFDKSLVNRQKGILEACYLSLISIRKAISTHPSAAGIVLPEWIDGDNIKFF